MYLLLIYLEVNVKLRKKIILSTILITPLLVGPMIVVVESLQTVDMIDGWINKYPSVRYA